MRSDNVSWFSPGGLNRSNASRIDRATGRKATRTPEPCTTSVSSPSAEADTPARHASHNDAGKDSSGSSQEHADRVQFIFGERPGEPSQLYRDVVEPSGSQPFPEMPHSRHDHLGDRQPYLRAR